MSRAGALALALALLGAAGCSPCARPSGAAVRNGPARDPTAAPPAGPPALRVLHLGDFGDHTCQQDAVAAAMARAHRRAPFDLAVDVGDLVYECGPDAASDAADACRFAADGNTVPTPPPYPPDPGFAIHDAPLAFLGTTEVHAVLGNHDLGHAPDCDMSGDRQATARAKACLAVAHRAPQWVMPGRHHAVDAGPARFILVDTNLVVGDYGGFSLEDEVRFVAAQAEGCGDRLCFLVGHHPPVTAGSHRSDATPKYVARMARLLAAGGGRIRAFLAGHDHDLQHLRTPDGMDVLVSGAGARDRRRERFERTAIPGARLLYGAGAWGYGVLEIRTDGWRYRFEDDRGEATYCCAAAGRGPCEPVACAAGAASDGRPVRP